MTLRRKNEQTEKKKVVPKRRKQVVAQPNRYDNGHGLDYQEKYNTDDHYHEQKVGPGYDDTGLGSYRGQKAESENKTKPKQNSKRNTIQSKDATSTQPKSKGTRLVANGKKQKETPQTRGTRLVANGKKQKETSQTRGTHLVANGKKQKETSQTRGTRLVANGKKQKETPQTKQTRTEIKRAKSNPPIENNSKQRMKKKNDSNLNSEKKSLYLENENSHKHFDQRLANDGQASQRELHAWTEHLTRRGTRGH